MKKVLSIVFCAFLLTSSILANVSCSSDNSVLEFKGDPVSVAGEMKWVKDGVLLDFTITNNTNKGIHVIYFEIEQSIYPDENSYISDYIQGWQPFETSGEMPFNTRSSWRDKIWPPTIKPGDNKAFSYNVGPLGFSSQIGPDWYAVACKYRLTVTRIEFKGYGIMELDEPLVYEFEWYKES